MLFKDLNIPYEMIAALEEKKLILFCGAGVSFSSNETLKAFGSFRELANTIGEKLDGVSYDERNRNRLCEHKLSFEAYFEQLCQKFNKDIVDKLIRELFYLGGEKQNRKQISAYGSLEKHKNLLRLSQFNKGARLVTTNFDNCFELAAKELKEELRHEQEKFDLPVYAASALPVPKASKWNGLVYLHGSAADSASDLIYSMSGFGRAYTTEQWAANFLKELFRGRFTVAFIGYGVNDPIMQYVLKAIAADKEAESETNTPNYRTAYIFTAEQEAKTKFVDMGLEPVFYSETNGHAQLWEGLAEWAQVNANGLSGKIKLANDYINSCKNFQAQGFSDEHKTFIEALFNHHDQTVAMKVLGTQYDKDLLAPTEWLAVFEAVDAAYRKKASADGSGNLTEVQKEMLKSPNVLQPNSPAKGLKYGRLVCDDLRFNLGRLHPTTEQIGRWLAKQLDKEEVLNFVLSNGCILHPDIKHTFCFNYEERCKAKQPPLPEALVKAWRLVLFHTTPKPNDWHDSFVGFERCKLEDIQEFEAAKIELLQQLTPRLELKVQSDWQKFKDNEEQLAYWLQCHVTLSTAYDYFLDRMLDRLKEHPEKLASFLQPLVNHLASIVSLSILTSSNDNERRLHWSRTSIEPHDQNSEISFKVDALFRWFWASLQAFIETKQPTLHALLEAWSLDTSLLFRRIALAACAEKKLNLDEAIPMRLLLGEDSLIFEPLARKEVMSFLKIARIKLGQENFERLASFVANIEEKAPKDEESHD